MKTHYSPRPHDIVGRDPRARAAFVRAEEMADAGDWDGGLAHADTVLRQIRAERRQVTRSRSPQQAQAPCPHPDSPDA